MKTHKMNWTYEPFTGYTFSYLCRSCNQQWYMDAPCGLATMILDCPQCAKLRKSQNQVTTHE